MRHRKRYLYAASFALAIAVTAAVVAAATGGTRQPRGSAGQAHHTPGQADYNARHTNGATTTTPPPGAATIAVHTDHPGRTVPPGFLGLSLEFPAVTAYAGTDPTALNPVFVDLIKALTPGQRPVLRIGGDSTDWTWWPTAATPKPPGVRITLTPRWLAVTNSLQQALQAKLILGINLEADNGTLAAAEARAFTTHLHGIVALEPGNEPELYPSFGWYRNRADQPVPGRRPGYDFASFSRDFAAVAQRLRAPLAGPATGSAKWMQDIPGFVTTAPDLRMVTVHRYPLQRCYTPPSAPIYPTVTNLLSSAAAAGLADSVVPDVKAAHAHHLALRVDEMNTISCGGSPLGHAPATALWAANALFAMATAGVDGVNIHSYPGATYALFRFKRRAGRWTATVAPEYYGLLLFAQAVPASARLLTIAKHDATGLDAWATEAPDGHIRLVLIDDDQHRGRTVAIGPVDRATIERLNRGGLTPPAPLRSDLVTLPPLSAALITYAR